MGAVGLDGKRDPYGISEKTRFSFGINDWGLNISTHPQLGLGGDIDGGAYQGPVKDAMVRSPSRMIAVGDVRALKNPAGINYNANMDPTANSPDHTEWPSSRHGGHADLLFCDGHVEEPVRGPVIDPQTDNPWRSRWNNDDQPHNEVKWTITAAYANAVDY